MFARWALALVAHTRHGEYSFLIVSTQVESSGPLFVIMDDTFESTSLDSCILKIQ